MLQAALGPARQEWTESGRVGLKHESRLQGQRWTLRALRVMLRAPRRLCQGPLRPHALGAAWTGMCMGSAAAMAVEAVLVCSDEVAVGRCEQAKDGRSTGLVAWRD